MRKRICVFCGANPGRNGDYTEAAERLGKALVDRNIALVYGGTTVGLMGSVAKTVTELGGEVHGVIPTFLSKVEFPNHQVTHFYEVGSMHERKQKMHDLSDAFIALPGGFGTMEEIFETLTWGQLGLHKKPSLFLNIKGYYRSLLSFFDHAIAEGFVRDSHRGLYLIEEDPVKAVGKLDTLIEATQRNPKVKSLLAKKM
ncbi:MAG: TIGR00730 family Rossman fold protein [Deltaproteobacteria bacterium]|nr:TIGR00730 family Rossman fold protein [Deltaproteobacteria bacterium]